MSPRRKHQLEVVARHRTFERAGALLGVVVAAILVAKGLM